jgi:hypothetical protein
MIEGASHDGCMYLMTKDVEKCSISSSMNVGILRNFLKIPVFLKSLNDKTMKLTKHQKELSSAPGELNSTQSCQKLKISGNFCAFPMASEVTFHINGLLRRPSRTHISVSNITFHIT